MKIKGTKKTKGFTIIEVVLVLAIAGLIFMMVFLALPALQKSQRDTQRKNDLSRIVTQITNYASNNRGKIPPDLTTSFVVNYLGGANTAEDEETPASTTAGGDYIDPTTALGYHFLEANDVVADIGDIGYSSEHLCGDDGVMTGTGTARQFAITIKLESQTAPYCLDNR